MQLESTSGGVSQDLQAQGDADLLLRLRAGDEAAFRALVLSSGGRMLAVALRFMRNMEDAQDCVQEAYASAFKGLDRFNGTSLLSTWLHRITVNACLMRLRTRRRRERERLIDPTSEEFDYYGFRQGPIAAALPTPEQLLESAQTRKSVRAAIDGLPEVQRIVLLLRDIEGVGADETAKLLGISPAASKARLHRARVALRNALIREMK